MKVKHTKIGLIMHKINILLILFSYFFLSLSSFNCTMGFKYDPLPDSRPEKLVIEYHLNGGMRYYSEALYICEDSSYYTINDGGAISRINFIMNANELNELYKVFLENKFDKIKTYEEKVYDRGGSSVYIQWEKTRFVSVSNSGMSFIDKNWQEEWSSCMNALDKIIKHQADLQKKDYEIKFDKSFFGKTVYSGINTEQIIPNSTLMAEHDYDTHISKSVKLIPGKHRLYLNWDKHFDNIQINTDSTKGINLKIINDSLKYEYIF